MRAAGGEPFLVPAMGSHGGGTAEGQRELIEGYGITESYCGCPIRASMETVVVCQARTSLRRAGASESSGASPVRST